MEQNFWFGCMGLPQREFDCPNDHPGSLSYFIPNHLTDGSQGSTPLDPYVRVLE